MSADSQYDLVIIGGGMVGATLARALAASPLQVALVEAAHPQTDIQGRFDLRVSAITRASQRVFEALDVWQGMQSRRVSPFREMHVWEEAGREIHFDSADLSDACVGKLIVLCVFVDFVFFGLEELALL
ncbi:MAG: FAD-dependent oxidoreductase, partial [Gammaproteobacteria bacterium]